MKIAFFTILVFFSAQQQSNAGVVRKPPAFATPVYSNSYLPAAMQVIFHAVDQLKHLEAEDKLSTSTTTTVSLPTTSPHPPGQHQPSSEEQALMQSTVSTPNEASTASIAYMASTVSELSTDSTVSEVSTDSAVPEASTTSDASQASSDFPISEASTVSTEAFEASVASTVSGESTASIAAINPTGSTPNFMTAAVDSATPSTVAENAGEINEERPEVVEEVTGAAESEAETPEANYATPEINHEVQETVQEVTESNQEIPEKNEGDESSPISSSLSVEAETPATTALPKPQVEKDSSEKDDCDQSSSEESEEKSSSEESKEKNDEAKDAAESKSDEDGSLEDEDDEIRFTLIGEKVAQVPRPSLSSYLKKTAKAPLRGSVQDLATLYDALSKDARKQGLGKYSGYSDEVLQTLESSVEGGVGPQLRTLLEKAQERNELTRDDAKTKLSAALKKLADPASILSRDLRRLVPLRYIP